jgi:hypothetical protein
MTILSSIKDDCIILLERALVGKTICAFGEDGCGKYGRSDTPMYFIVSCIAVSLESLDLTTKSPMGKLFINLDGYDANVHGHALTDVNFEISLHKLLANENITPNAITWGDINDQTRDNVVMNIDVYELLC